jgi:uncharacterized membrane protein YccF (DUF307 family)
MTVCVSSGCAHHIMSTGSSRRHPRRRHEVSHTQGRRFRRQLRRAPTNDPWSPPIPAADATRAPAAPRWGPATVGVVRVVGNIIWLLLAGFWLALAYVVAGVLAIVGIVTIPLALPAFKLAGYALWPFGRMVILRPDRDVALNAIGNVVWLILCGWWLAIGHVIAAVLLAITIIGIPFAVASLKMAGLALWPYGRTVVPIPPDGTLPPDAVAVRAY